MIASNKILKNVRSKINLDIYNHKVMKLENYFIKIIDMFGHSSSEILIVTSNITEFEICQQNLSKKLICNINPEQGDLIGLLTLHQQEKKYDLVILDRVWDRSDKISKKLQRHETRKRILQTIDKNLSSHGQIICLADNKLNLKKPAQCIKSLLNFIVKGDVSPFSTDYLKPLKKAGYCNIKSFFLFPNVENFNRIISDNRTATLVFTIKTHDLTHNFPKQIALWPKWLLVWIGIDAWLMPTYLYWGRK